MAEQRHMDEARRLAHSLFPRCTGGHGYGPGGDSPRWHSKTCEAATASIATALAQAERRAAEAQRKANVKSLRLFADATSKKLKWIDAASALRGAATTIEEETALATQTPDPAPAADVRAAASALIRATRNAIWCRRPDGTHMDPAETGVALNAALDAATAMEKALGRQLIDRGGEPDA